MAQRTLLGAAVAIILAAAAGWFALNARWAAQTANLERDKAVKATEQTQHQLDRANQALAKSINDLGFEPDKPLCTRQRNALWKLALADEPIKRDFVSILASSPDETIRVSPGLAQISRALGLLKAGQVRDLVLTQIGRTTDPEAFQTLARALEALPQASQAIEPVLKQIGQTANPEALRALAQALQALAEKLTEAQAAQASEAAAASLAWAAHDVEAAQWARALVALSERAADRDRLLVTAIAYPTAAAGSATEILLDAIRVRHPDAPAKERGTEAALEWLAKTFPDVLRPPVCPQPLQPGLKFPP